jgi:hypothetical protein
MLAMLDTLDTLDTLDRCDAPRALFERSIGAAFSAASW